MKNVVKISINIEIIKIMFFKAPGLLRGIPPTLRAKILLSQIKKQAFSKLVFETKDSEIEKTMSIVIKEMSEAHKPVVDLSVDLKVEAASGKNWDQAH